MPGPERPGLPEEGAVEIWRAALDAPLDLPTEWLDAGERGRLSRLRTETLRRRWGAARWALREVLGRYLDEDPASLELVADEQGKPGLTGASSGLQFNLSHSAALALIAVAPTAVGIDVEATERQRDFLALAERWLEPGAATLVRAAAPARRGAVFYAAWTQHEARLKCHGGGIAGGPPGAPVAVGAVPVGSGYAAAVAIPGETPARQRGFTIDPA